ncbi:MAG TPA: SAM-dependent methyltransferase, partial [Phycisphaerae bacterium]|nr:SAM-dependent methyltransferase [Phycisphaerae bacterium]
EHPNRRYFVLKSIVIQNLYGVDIMDEAVEICKLRLFLKLVAQIERAEDIEPLPDIDFNIRAGNTLVGFATRESVREALSKEQSGQQKMVYGEEAEALKKIEEKAGDVDDLFTMFREQQTELGGTVTATDKDALRKRLGVLENELNRLLATQYSVEPSKSAAYRTWLKSHQPFHWFVEFYGIMKHGGFDTLIGNPPYVELTQVTDYRLLDYKCLSAGNLYALFLERSLAMCPSVGRLGFIVPVSSVSTDRYAPLQKLLVGRELHYSSYDDRPSRLFEGLQHARLTIHILSPAADTPCLYSTRYNKWNAIERQSLLQRLTFAAASTGPIPGSMPKFSAPLEGSLLAKLGAEKAAMADFYDPAARWRTFYSRKVGYFLQALDFTPRVLDGRGKTREPSEFKTLHWGSQEQATGSLACLNSSLFFWFITVFSDCRHVNKREVDAFPVNMDRLMESSVSPRLSNTVARLMKDFKRNSEERRMRFQHDTLTIQCIVPKKSKDVIDEIDGALAEHYNLTGEELDFIVNYDIKYRMGGGDDDGDDE